jgi:RNA polymerase sigma-70 factor (ECF subfamily)
MLGNIIASASDTPSVHAENREQQAIIAEVLESLPEDSRSVIVMRNLRGMSHREIAYHMERSEAAVRMLWLRALKQLQVGVLERQ